MKNLLSLLLIIFSVSSCGEYTYVETDPIYGTEYTQTYATDGDINIIITNGTPHYYNGRLWYYHYNGLYYYPFWYDGYWYLRPYTTLYSWGWYYDHYRHFRPGPRDRYRFRPGHHGFHKPDHGHLGRPHESGYKPGGRTPNRNHGSHGYGTHPSINNGRAKPGGSVRTQPHPNVIPRGNTGPVRPHGGAGSHSNGAGRRRK